MARSSKITIRDVAARAGCGVATASRVLNRSGATSADSRERVERAAAELGFSFSAIGRALQSSRSMTVGVLVPSLANPVFAEAVQGTQEELRDAGYQCLIASSTYDPARDAEALGVLTAKQVDGLIVTMVAPEESPALGAARTRDIPAVLMFHDPRAGLLSAHVDNAAAAREVARQCAAAGHRATGFLALRFSTSDRSRARFTGFTQGCAELGMAAPVLVEVSEAEAASPDALARTLAAHPDLTAIFASNDFLAIALQRAARELGLRVPRDLSVVGFDGIEIGRHLDRPLTTVETDPEAMGRQAARLLLAMLRGETPEQPAPLPFTFRPGATLAAPAEDRDDDRAATRSPSAHPDQNPSLKRT
ncbi:substrate-binding domain-containing protein [Alloyangia pacifica]|uniref:Transcriptional regulator, LacI family n=1 Tax=Alloyangia pacifica TaxID=311180 RepID=A0A1I6UWK2_9RHOB|nr:substrate-binding domain-containing protein [Alloyangia pacifica]SDI28400.1 transcriptional regulator, LacI family [Alloyangia pacifica]SFT05783.1 transcriptional regulator, LacI family [Alloyangia pacifica]